MGGAPRSDARPLRAVTGLPRSPPGEGLLGLRPWLPPTCLTQSPACLPQFPHLSQERDKGVKAASGSGVLPGCWGHLQPEVPRALGLPPLVTRRVRGRAELALSRRAPRAARGLHGPRGSQGAGVTQVGVSLTQEEAPAPGQGSGGPLGQRRARAEQTSLLVYSSSQTVSPKLKCFSNSI